MRLKVALLATALCAPATVGFAQTASQTPPAQPAAQPAAQAQAQTPAKPGSTGVKEVVVTGQASGFRSSIDKRSYSVSSDLGATTGSIGDALRNIPSVEVDVQGNVSLRGDANVTILIDGRPSGLFKGDNRGDALQQLPADRIDRVEVMTNPSAAYSPDGTAGVINLVTKKTAKAGRSATVRGNVGTDGRWNGGVSASYNSDKLTVTSDVGVRHDAFEPEFNTDRTRFVGADALESAQRTKVDVRPENVNGRVGVDYDLDKATRVSAEIRRNQGKFNADTRESYQSLDAFGAPDSIYTRTAHGAADRSNTEGSLSWRRRFDGRDDHELVADLSVERSEMARRQTAELDFTLPADPSEFEDLSTAFDETEARLKVDYSRPLPGDAKLKTGLEVVRTEDDFDNKGFRGLDPNALSPVASLTNRFLYDQTVSAVYGTYERPLGQKLKAQAGLRLEQVNIDFDQVTSAIKGGNDYFKAYPSLHLSYDLTPRQQLTGSYSLRVQRPGPQDLNPYVVYMDPFNSRSGNPNLKPQETHSWEAGWQYRTGQTFYLATAYYRQTDNGFTDVVTVQPDGSLLTTKDNLAKNRSGGLELVANGKLTKTLSYNVSSNLFWNEIEGSALLGTPSRSGTSIGGRGNLNWQVTPKDLLQVNAFVIGERLVAQGRVLPTGMLNLGYRHKFDDKLSLVFTAQDVLGTFRMKSEYDTPELRERSERRMSPRGAFIGLTYTFGDKPKRQKDNFDYGGGVDAGGGS